MAKQTFTTGQVLTAAQMTSLQQTAMQGGAASAKTASYTLVAADAGTAISMSNASATTITVNTGLFAAGDTVHITNLGAGVTTITAGTATVNSSASLALAQYESGFLDFTSTSAAIFVKGAGAAPTSSSGLTFITSTTFSNVTGANIDSIFSSSYENYLVILDDLAAVGGTSYIALQFRYSSTTQTTGYYTSNFGYSSGNAIETNGKDNGATYVVLRVGETAGLLGSAQFFVSNVGNSSECPTVRGQFSSPQSAHTGVFGGRVTAQTYTGIRVLTDPTVGNQLNISGRITVYGLAKA